MEDFFGEVFIMNLWQYETNLWLVQIKRVALINLFHFQFITVEKKCYKSPGIMMNCMTRKHLFHDKNSIDLGYGS